MAWFLNFCSLFLFSKSVSRNIQVYFWGFLSDTVLYFWKFGKFKKNVCWKNNCYLAIVQKLFFIRMLKANESYLLPTLAHAIIEYSLNSIFNKHSFTDNTWHFDTSANLRMGSIYPSNNTYDLMSFCDYGYSSFW